MSTAIDLINSPSHYVSGGIETIDVIEDVAANDYLNASGIKYASRCERKGNKLEDLKKCRWFVRRIRERDAAGGILPIYGLHRFDIQEVVKAFAFKDARVASVLSALLAYGRYRVPAYALTALTRLDEIIEAEELAAMKPDTIPPPSRDGFASADPFKPPPSRL